jgi:hypothetical protein
LAAIALILTLAAALLIAGADKQQIKINTERLTKLESTTVTKEDLALLRQDIRSLMREIREYNTTNSLDHTAIKERLAKIEVNQEKKLALH